MLLRLIGGPAIFAVVLVWVDVPEVLSRLGDLHFGWAALAAVVGIAQMLGSAWRWRFTADRLDIRLPFGSAVREYWLAGFLNQVIPGGVVGDVSRAIRHARDEARGRDGDAPGGGPEGRAVHAVILERLSGQVVVAVAAAVSAVTLLTPVPGDWAVAGGLAGLLVIVTGRASMGPDRGAIPGRDRLRDFSDSLRSALLARRALPVQLLTSIAVVGSYVAMYLAAARAVGVETPFVTMLPLVTPVLLAMLIPVSVAGWGVREGAAAAIWAWAGLPAADGVAISVAYGLLVLVSTLPGALVLVGDGVMRRRGEPSPSYVSRPGRDRTEDPTRADDAGRAAAARRPEPGPGGG